MPDSEFPLDEDEPQEGNGAARVPLSEAITEVQPESPFRSVSWYSRKEKWVVRIKAD